LLQAGALPSATAAVRLRERLLFKVHALSAAATTVRLL
jgi:hypothetical protein